MFESMALTSFAIRLLFHLGIVVAICSYNNDAGEARYRPVVGVAATAIAGSSAAQIFIELRQFYTNSFYVDFEPFETLLVGALFLALVNTGGNVAMFVRPIQNAYDGLRKIIHAK